MFETVPQGRGQGTDNMAAKRIGKAGRIQAKLFPAAKQFNPKQGKYSALPWCLRRVQWLFPPRTWQILTYLVMRCGPEGVTWQTDRQIAVDIDVTYRKVAPHLRELHKLGFIEMQERDGERFICLLDPFTALDALAKRDKIQGDKLERLNEDLETMGLPTVPVAETPVAATNATAAAPVAAAPARTATPEPSPDTRWVIRQRRASQAETLPKLKPIAGVKPLKRATPKDA